MHRPVRGNVRKFRGEVCNRDRRKDRKEHKIPSLKTKEVGRKVSRPGGWCQRTSGTRGARAWSLELGSAAPATHLRLPCRHGSSLHPRPAPEHGIRCPRPRWATSLGRDRSRTQLCSGQWRLWRFLLPGSGDSHGGVSMGSAPPAGLRVAPARAAVREGK